MSNKKLTIGLVMVAIIAIIGLFTPTGSKILGAITGETNFNTLGISGLKLNSTCNDSFGSSGCQTFTKFLSGTCNASFDGTTLYASSSKQFICQSASNVASGDGIFINMPAAAGAGSATSTAGAASGATASSTQIGFVGFGAFATTSGQFGFTMANFTGAATTSFPQATTSIQYWIVR